MKSGSKFRYISGCEFKPQIYTLQKLPDFDLWMLIDGHGKMFLPPMSNAQDAFGMWFDSFQQITD